MCGTLAPLIHTMPTTLGHTRRTFLRRSALAGLATPLLVETAAGSGTAAAAGALPFAPPGAATPEPPADRLDLAPARWIWYPSARTLANTFVLFRRTVSLPAAPRRAQGWIAADSRYLLSVNGQRVQWGPPPCDPRWLEADPLDLSSALRAGENVLAATVLHYGHGDGTWPLGKPGFIFRLELEMPDGSRVLVVSDDGWSALLARAWRPGQYKRWYLRALQEDFDARRYPSGWDAPGFAPGEGWLPAMPLTCASDKPPVCSSYNDYAQDTGGSPPGAALRPRSIPMLVEDVVPVARLRESTWIDWRRPPEDYFDCVVPDAFTVDRRPSAREIAAGEWAVDLAPGRAAALTFELAEQAVGWPSFTIEAPPGTIVELMVQEAHEPGGPALLNTHFHAWTRFTCREGVNAFETFDFESCRWLQLHLRNAGGPVVIRGVGLRRRRFPWPAPAAARVGEPALQRLVDACVNTLHNSAQETCVDGMGRERQQYSGDGGHQLHAIYLAFGETRLPGRFVRTFSQGLMASKFFLDSWPAYDRVARLGQREMGLSAWGPLLDHGIGFVFDCYHHWLYTGRMEEVDEAWPRLLRFVDYLLSLRRNGRGLLPVEGLGIPTVWIDHQAYREQREKQLAFNLYAAAMLSHALAPLADARGDAATAARARLESGALRRAAVARFWSAGRGLFVNNLPWASGGDVRLCDRSLATSILFDQCPANRSEEAATALAECPPNMGFSYPCNAGWRFWALARAGRTQPIVDEWRGRWATMRSVRENNTIQEDWEAAPDSGSQWSHSAVAPLYGLFMCLAGIAPTRPGFARFEVRPQPADLERLDVTARTPRGPLGVRCEGTRGSRSLRLSLPADGEGLLVLDARETVLLPPAGPARRGLRRYALPAGREVALDLAFT